MDTTQSKHAFERIIGKLENRKTDILVGTQMVTKGLDFDHVSVVGILNADNLINFPDFRSYERAYQLISQVSGRAGRKNNRGSVVIQTTQPDNPLIQYIRNQDYTTLFKLQAEERLLFKYPPYFRLIKLTVKHKNIETVNRVADTLGKELRKIENLIVLGPEFPLISRIQLWHHKEIWIKIDRVLNQIKFKNLIRQCVANVKQQPDNSNCVIQIDVDPS
jgi:primosomal protein N' (replication factor Y) (superfamily II helicase)